MKRLQIVFIEDDEKTNIKSDGEGFSLVEIVGLLEYHKQQILAQINPSLKGNHSQ